MKFLNLTVSMICAFAIALMPTQATSATMSSSAPAANDSETTPPSSDAPTRSAMVKHKFREKKAKGKKRPGRTAARSIARHPWCGHTEKKQRYGIKVFGKYFNVVTHKTGLTSCVKKRKITAVSKHSHSCKKSAWAIANTITKSFSQGASGVRSSTNLFECNFHGGAQIKGVGFGVTRDLYTRIRATAPKRNDMLHYYNSWTSCC